MKEASHETWPHCGKEHKIPMYAYAHWNEEMKVTCTDCGKKYKFYQGRTWK